MLAILLLLLVQQQQPEPDLSKYGSLARQQIVRENLRLQQQTQEIKLREYERRQRPPQPDVVIVYTPSTYRYSDHHYDTRRTCYEPRRSERYYGRRHIGGCSRR